MGRRRQRVLELQGLVDPDGELNERGERLAEDLYEREPEPDYGVSPLLAPEPLNDAGLM